MSDKLKADPVVAGPAIIEIPRDQLLKKIADLEQENKSLVDQVDAGHKRVQQLEKNVDNLRESKRESKAEQQDLGSIVDEIFEVQSQIDNAGDLRLDSRQVLELRGRQGELLSKLRNP